MCCKISYKCFTKFSNVQTLRTQRRLRTLEQGTGSAVPLTQQSQDSRVSELWHFSRAADRDRASSEFGQLFSDPVEPGVPPAPVLSESLVSSVWSWILHGPSGGLPTVLYMASAG